MAKHCPAGCEPTRAGYDTQSGQGIGNRGVFAVTLRAPSKRAHYALNFTIMDPSEITQLIEAGFDGAHVRVESDDNTHFGALVVAKEFEGKRAIARHQLVYKSLGSLVGNEIHALSITALTPEEWQQRSQ